MLFISLYFILIVLALHINIFWIPNFKFYEQGSIDLNHTDVSASLWIPQGKFSCYCLEDAFVTITNHITTE